MHLCPWCEPPFNCSASSRSSTAPEFRSTTLSVPQRLRRIDLRRSPGRTCDRHRRGHRHQHRHHREVTKSSGWTPNNTEPINRPNTAARIKPMTAPAVTTRSALDDDETQHVARRRAERPAHPEITHALLDRVREDAEHADHRQRDRERREGRHHHRPEPVPSGGRPLDVLERDHVADADQLLLVDP